MKPAQVWVLGAVQCVYWGVLFYAFSVLLVPLAHSLRLSQALVAGAFSAGLAVSAAIAPAVGRALDRGAGVRITRAGAWATPALLLLWSHVDSAPALYAVWLGLGACMGLVLYESSFALVTRAFAAPRERLRALATVTVFGGLASTVFLPLTGWSVVTFGWRHALLVLVLAWLLATWLLERMVLSRLEDGGRVAPAREPAPPVRIARRALLATSTPFVLATFAGMALTTLLIPMLVARGHSITLSSVVLAGFGLMQLPGRVWLLRGGGEVAPWAMLPMPLLLQAAGLLIVATTTSLAAVFAGVALFGLGAGLYTVARPWAVPLLVGIDAAGAANGRIARAQGIARAIGPAAAASLMAAVGPTPTFVVIALVLLAALPLALHTAGRIGAPGLASSFGQAR